MKLAAQIGIQHLEAFGNSKLVVNRVPGGYKVLHQDLIPYHTPVIKIAEKFCCSFIEQVRRKKNALADAMVSLAASLALPAGFMKRVLISALDLCCPKIVPKEDINSTWDPHNEEVLDISTSPELRDRRFPLSNYTLDRILEKIPRRGVPSKGRLLNIIIMRCCVYSTDVHLMESYFSAYQTNRHKKCSKRPTTAHVEPTNLVQSSVTEFVDWDSTGQRFSWHRHLCKMMVCLSNPWEFHPPTFGMSPFNKSHIVVWNIGHVYNLSY